MIHAIRTQVDRLNDEMSAAAGISFEGVTDLARQEFREEADVNVLMSRYGVGDWSAPAPQFGEVDWDIDLHTAHISIDRAQQAFYHLPSELQQKYQTTSAMLDAMNSGELAEDLHRVLKASEPGGDPDPSPEPDRGSEGDSQPGNE